MPGAPLDLDLPIAGDSWPTWKSKIEAAFAAIEADLEPAVLFSELSATSNLNYGNYAATNVKYVQFYLGNSTNIPARGLGFKDGELWVTDAAGNQIQFTNAGALNVAAAGGFTGEYISAGAQASFVNATDLYEFKNEAGAAYADIRCDDLFLSNASTAYFQIGFAGSSNISVLMPTALPAGAALLSVDNTGQISASATLAVGFTINNADITLTGTADVLHPDRTRTEPAQALYYSNTSSVGSPSSLRDGGHSVTGAWEAHYHIPGLRVGERLKSVALRLNRADATATTLEIYSVTNGVRTSISAVASTTTTGDVTLTATVTTPATNATGTWYYAQMNYNGAGLNFTRDVRWTVDNT